MKRTADILIPEMFMAKGPGYDQRLVTKVGSTLGSVDAGVTTLHSHGNAMEMADRAPANGQAPGYA
jgi:hypothetical protein